MKAMMLTAGLGTRLRPVTERFAKPAVPFLNIPLLYYPVILLEELGISSLVLNTHHKPEQIEALSQRIPGSEFAVAYSHEPDRPLGSGGGIQKARKLLEGNGDFLVCNGDEVILPHDDGIMARFREEHFKHKALATILVMKHPGVGSQFGGVWTATDGSVRGFGKDAGKFPDTTGYHYPGLLLLNERIFSYLPDGESNILYDALAAAIKQGETVRAVVGTFTWFETGNPHDFLLSTQAALGVLRGQGGDSDILGKICRRFWPAGMVNETNGSATILKSPTAQLESSVSLKGFVVLGENTAVDSGAHLENVVLLPGARVNRPHVNEIMIPSL